MTMTTVIKKKKLVKLIIKNNNEEELDEKDKMFNDSNYWETKNELLKK